MTATKPTQLLVEGNDDRNFFSALIDHMSLADIEVADIEVQSFGGVNQLRPTLRTFAETDSFANNVASLGIIRDAETSAQSAFRSVQDSLRSANLAIPDNPGQKTPGPPSVSVFILPDNRNAGMLETLLCQTFQGEPIDDCIEDFLRCARLAVGEDMRNPDKSKANAFLSTMPRPEVSVGVAARRSYWNLDHPAFSEIRAFLRTL